MHRPPRFCPGPVGASHLRWLELAVRFARLLGVTYGILLAVLLLNGFAQTTSKMIWPVYVDHLGDDFVGKQIAQTVANKLKESPNYAPLDTAYNGELGFFRIMLTSVAVVTTTGQNWSALSVVYTLDLPDSPFGTYLNSAVYFRSAEDLNDLGDKIIQNLDTAIQNYSLWKKSKESR